MTDNILKKHVERTYPPPVRAPAGPATGGAKELVAEVYPAALRLRDRPQRLPDGEGEAARGEDDGARARLLRNQQALRNDWSEAEIAEGREGMEGMAKGWDGSRHCTEQSLRTHPLLANLRSLIGEERIRNIAGRPRKPPEKEPDQLEFAFPDAA